MIWLSNELLSYNPVIGINIAIIPDYKGKGYGAKSIKILTEYSFTNFNFPNIVAIVSRQNSLSSKLFIKSGYTYIKSYRAVSGGNFIVYEIKNPHL